MAKKKSSQLRSVEEAMATAHRKALAPFLVSRRGRGQGRTDEEYAALALQYDYDIALGLKWRDVPRDWERRYGVAARMWSKYFAEARERKLLTESGAGCTATPLAGDLVGERPISSMPTDKETDEWLAFLEWEASQVPRMLTDDESREVVRLCRLAKANSDPRPLYVIRAGAVEFVLSKRAGHPAEMDTQ
jgi:hypothetical protein